MRHPMKFRRVSRLGFLTALTSLKEGQPHFARCLAVSCASFLVHYIYIFVGSCPLTQFCRVQHSLCVQVLRSLILAALLHGTVGISPMVARSCALSANAINSAASLAVKRFDLTCDNMTVVLFLPSLCKISPLPPYSFALSLSL